MASAAYEELTRGLNNADKRRLAQIVEERTVRLKIDKAVAEERLRVQLEDAKRQPRKRLSPPYDEREDAVLLKQLPVAPGMRSAVARARGEGRSLAPQRHLHCRSPSLP